MSVLRFEASGPPDAPVLVCLHGIGGDARSFHFQVKALSDRWRVLAVNLPGYGGSPLPAHALDFAAMTHDILELLDSLATPTAHMAGHSLGGMLVQELLETAPERVASATLIATTSAFGSRDGKFQEEFISARLAPLDAGKSLRELAPAIVANLVGDEAPPDAVVLAERSLADVPEATFRAAVHCLTTFDRRDAAAASGRPVLLVAGEKDTNAPARTMARMHERIPGARYHCAAGAGHFVHMERAPEVNAILREFLESTG